MALEQNPGLLDLEKELTCSICTDVLYQPLTLLKCLHTFCGSCLQEWFSWQGTQAASSRIPNDHPFTCPSCRSIVDETKPNAAVTTLLDMFTQANPGRGKNAEEKADIAKRYKPGDQVMPKIRHRVVTREDEEDRRQIEQVLGESLREVGISGDDGRLAVREQRTPRRSRESSRDDRTTDESARRRRMEQRARHRDDTHNNIDRHGPARQRAAARQIEHQSSLRSLLSASDVDSSDLEEEILRQIMEENLLDGVNLDNIDVSQEDALSEKIADAYRRRQEERRRARIARHGDSGPGPVVDRDSRQRGHSRSNSAAVSTDNLSRPPPVLQTQSDLGQHSTDRRRRATSTTRVEGPTNVRARRASIDASRSTGRPSADSFESRSARANQNRPPDLSQTSRRTTDPEPQRAAALPRSITFVTAPSSPSRPTHTSPQASASLEDSKERSNSATATSHPPQNIASIPRRRTLYSEPSVTCENCKRTQIEYELHVNCPKCKNGEYNICLNCYRAGVGCLNWYGFGSAGWQRYEAQAPPEGYPAGHPLPHSLDGHRYLKPSQNLIKSAAGDTTQPLLTSEDPRKRLQAGVFCDICLECANDCFWKCEICNEGEWCFCDRCVNQGRCCTHPLFPLTNMPSTGKSRSGEEALNISPVPKLPPSASLLQGPGVADQGPLKPLVFNTKCDICRTQILPTSTRFHCAHCNNGDYNICTPCYHRLVSTNKISLENGHNGWRRCLNSHRMIILGFEDKDGGQRRVIDRDLVGGLALDDKGAHAFEGRWYWPEEGGARKEKRLTGFSASSPSSSSSSGTPQGGSSTAFSPSAAAATVAPTAAPIQTPKMKMPPDGGVGLKVSARWSYYPAEEMEDEILFPKYAEIREVQVMNDEWYWGVYAGAKGMLPASRVKIIGEVK